MSLSHLFCLNKMVAALTVATIVISCGHKLASSDTEVSKNTPVQTADSLYATRVENGILKFRLETGRMEKYQVSEDESYEDYSGGFNVFGYNADGLLETEIIADKARHTVMGKGEKWSAFGDVVITNYIKGEVITTDTIYWDQKEKKISTDCYVRLETPQGLMQGYGMESDEMVRHAFLLRPFDSYGIVDSTKVEYTDTANFIGPRF